MKYGNKKTVIDGIQFASLKEAQRYQELKLLEHAGEIRNLQLQPKFKLQEAFKDKDNHHHRSIYYIADFIYRDKRKKWEWVVEDTKGFRNAVYKLKLKLFLYRYPYYFLET